MARSSQLARELNFRFIQHNGRRIFGPERSLLGLVDPGFGCEVFVSRLPGNLFEDELYKFFRGAGEIFNIRLFVNYDSQSKGYAFVKFREPSSANLALLLHKRHIRPGHPVVVVMSTDHKTLHIDLSAYWLSGSHTFYPDPSLLQLPPDATYKQYTREEVTNKIIRLMQLEGLFNQFALDLDRNGVYSVEFEEHRDAVLMLRALRSAAAFWWGKHAVVKFQPNIQVDLREARKRQNRAPCSCKTWHNKGDDRKIQ